MMTLDEVLSRLERPRRCAGGWVARCPAHDDHDPSLSIREGDNGKVLLKCHRGCDYARIRAALGEAPALRKSQSPTSALRAPADEKRRIEWARKLWREASEARGTIVQDYLFGRAFTGELPYARQTESHINSQVDYSVGLAIPASLRFHRRLKHPSNVYLPAMVAAVQDANGSIVAIHRTFLKPDGTGKAEVEPNKLALGPVRGCSVHLTAGGVEVALCEGIETGLSILQATGIQVWVALGTSNLATVALPTFVRKVIVAADQDEPGIKAAKIAAEAYGSQGYQVSIVSPQTDKADWNDVLKRESGCQARM